MADPLGAADRVIYAALAAPGAVAAPVYQHAPRNAPYPVVIVGEMTDVRPLGRAGDLDREGRVTVLAMTEGEQRLPCAALLGQIEAALDGRTLTDGDWQVTLTIDASTCALDEEGQGYNGIALFAMTILRA